MREDFTEFKNIGRVTESDLKDIYISDYMKKIGKIGFTGIIFTLDNSDVNAKDDVFKIILQEVSLNSKRVIQCRVFVNHCLDYEFNKKTFKKHSTLFDILKSQL